MMPLEDAQQKKLGETLGITTEDFMMGRRLTKQMEPCMMGRPHLDCSKMGAACLKPFVLTTK